MSSFAATLARGTRLHRSACENLTTPEALLPLRDLARSSGTPFNPAADHLQSFEWVLKLLGDPGSINILVIEDLHWADTVTLDLVRFLSRRISPLRALVVLTYRDEEVDARSPLRAVLGEAPPGVVQRLRLEPLSLAAVTALAEKTDRSGADLFALTAGNPFLVTEMLAVDSSVPTASIRDATLARAARLSPAGRAVLEAVSLFPRHAETSIVGDMVKLSFEAGVDACVERGMLELEGARLRFRHELARLAVEACIAPARRRTLHQAIVNELVRRPHVRASEIAHHAERSGDVAALLTFARRAGDEAARAGAPREAAAHYATLLGQRESLPDSSLAELLEVYADQCYLMGSADLAKLGMQEAAERRRAAGEILNLGRDLTRLARFAWMCGDRHEAEAFVAEAVRVLEGAPPGVELAWAYSHRSQLEMLANDMVRALVSGRRALELAQQLDATEVQVHALGNIGSAQADSRDCTDFADLERSLALATAGRYHDHVERATCNLTCSHYARRDWRAALRYIEQGVSYALTRELTHWEGYLRGWRAMVLIDRGQWGAAEDEIALILSRRYSSGVYRFPALVALARLRIRRGDPDADAPLDAARELSDSLAELQRSVYVAVLTAEQAWLCADTGAPTIEGAVALLKQVHALATQRHARWMAEDTSWWLVTLGESVASDPTLSMPFLEYSTGDWQSAARGWSVLGRPYEQAIALSLGTLPRNGRRSSSSMGWAPHRRQAA